MTDQNQTQPQTPPRPLEEIWKDIEAMNISANDVAKAAEQVRTERETKEQIQKVRDQLKKQSPTS